MPSLSGRSWRGTLLVIGAWIWVGTVHGEWRGAVVHSVEVLSCRCLSLVDECTQSLSETCRPPSVLSPTTLDTPRFLLALGCDINILSMLNISEIESSILWAGPPSPPSLTCSALLFCSSDSESPTRNRSRPNCPPKSVAVRPYA